MKNTTANKSQEFKMRTLQILAAATVLVASTSVNASWWGPFDNDDDYNHNGYNNNNWDNNVFGDMMSDMTGDMDVNMEMKFKVKAKGRGRGNANNYWNGYNNYNGYNYYGYNNGYVPYGYNGYALQYQAPVQSSPAVHTIAQ